MPYCVSRPSSTGNASRGPAATSAPLNKTRARVSVHAACPWMKGGLGCDHSEGDRESPEGSHSTLALGLPSFPPSHSFLPTFPPSLRGVAGALRFRVEGRGSPRPGPWLRSGHQARCALASLTLRSRAAPGPALSAPGDGAPEGGEREAALGSPHREGRGQHPGNVPRAGLPPAACAPGRPAGEGGEEAVEGTGAHVDPPGPRFSQQHARVAGVRSVPSRAARLSPRPRSRPAAGGGASGRDCGRAGPRAAQVGAAGVSGK